MYETINTQLKSGRTLNQNRYFSVIRKDPFPKHFQELYPFGNDYYHELNPYFVSNISRPEHFNFSKTITVRDGALSFSHFLLQTIKILPKLKTHFIIHPSLIKLIPENYRASFSTWKIVQKEPQPISKAKKLMITGLMCDQSIGTLEKFKQKLKFIDELSHDAEIDVFLPLRQNPFQKGWIESTFFYEALDMLKTKAGNRKITYLKTKEILEKPSYMDVFLNDLNEDFLITDSYMNHLVSGRGGTSSRFITSPPQDSLFAIDLSFYHALHVCPLPEVQSDFGEIYFYMKKAPHSELLTDFNYHSLVRKIIS